MPVLTAAAGTAAPAAAAGNGVTAGKGGATAGRAVAIAMASNRASSVQASMAT